MWIKQFYAYEIGEEANLSITQAQLEEFQFTPCTAQEAKRWGWIDPSNSTGDLQLKQADFIFLKARLQEKLLPGSVVNEQLAEKVEQIQHNEGRKLGKNERQTLKDEITFDLLPKAFKRKKDFALIINTKKRRLIVGCASDSQSDDLTHLLRESLGSLPLTPLANKLNFSDACTDWLKNQSPAFIEPQEDVELVDKSDSTAKVKMKNLQLDSSQLNSYLDDGLRVSQLGIAWREKLQCALKDNGTIKRIKYLDDWINEQNLDIEDDYQALCADILLQDAQLNHLIDDLLTVCGIQ